LGGLSNRRQKEKETGGESQKGKGPPKNPTEEYTAKHLNTSFEILSRGRPQRMPYWLATSLLSFEAQGLVKPDELIGCYRLFPFVRFSPFFISKAHTKEGDPDQNITSLIHWKNFVRWKGME
jgi:hypothetical protein